MAGNGPAPKPAAQRRRRNKTSTARTLRPVTGEPTAPKLPQRRIGGKPATWTTQTKRWWDEVWSSPMAGEFDPSDLHGLLILAVLVDVFWRDPCPDNAKELRLHRAAFGLTPIDRRRLQWEIERGEEAAAATADRRKPKAVKAAADPRANAG